MKTINTNVTIPRSVLRRLRNVSDKSSHHNHHHHHHTSVMELGHFVDPFRSHVSRSLFRGLPRFLLPVGEKRFIILGSLSRGILFKCCVQSLLYSCSLSRTGVISNSIAMCKFVF
jgi:hypothetical protein